MLLALGLGSLGIFLSGTHHPANPPVTQSTRTPAPRSTASPPTATPTPPLSLYPQLALSYAGRIGDSGVAHTVTNLYLAPMKQNQGQISGHFQGLYQSGPFTGTVSTDGAVNFTVKISVGVVICKGNIKVGGELVGTFSVVDQHGNSLGEYGAWSADPPPS